MLSVIPLCPFGNSRLRAIPATCCILDNHCQNGLLLQKKFWAESLNFAFCYFNSSFIPALGEEKRPKLRWYWGERTKHVEPAIFRLSEPYPSSQLPKVRSWSQEKEPQLFLFQLTVGANSGSRLFLLFWKLAPQAWRKQNFMRVSALFTMNSSAQSEQMHFILI